jgi:two-component system, NtrC family, sensor kinase
MKTKGSVSGMKYEKALLTVAFGAILAAAVAGELALAAAYARDPPEALASAILIGSALAGVCIVSWLFARRLLRPLGAIASAMEAFSKGTPEAEAEGALPARSPPSLAFLVATINEYMRSARARRAELEGNVASRTLELELRNALLRSIASSDDDDLAYEAVAEAAMCPLGADSALVAFYDELRLPRAAIRTGGRTTLRGLETAEAEALERAAAGDPVDLPFLGARAGSYAAYRLEALGEHCGFAVLGREEKAFDPGERAVLEKVFSSFSVQARMRKRRAQELYVRREAERALRQSEERLRTFFAESKDMIYSTNADDVIASINDAGLALLGLADRFEALGQPFSNHLLSAGDRATFLTKVRERGFVVDFECIFRRKDGTSVFCIETARAVKDKSGNILEIQGIVKDISERIASERELWKANLELAETNEKLRTTKMLVVQQEKLASIGQLAAGVAHEINNPLGFLSSNQATIEGFIKALRESWEEARSGDPARMGEIARRHDLDYVLGEIDAVLAESGEGFRRIIDIVQNLKSFSRIDVAPVMAPYNLNEGIKSTLVVARNEIKYVADVEMDLGELPSVSALGGEVNQVFLNILVNAAQAIESQKRESKGRILVSTRLEGNREVVVIADDGPGIPDEIKLKVFDPFFTTKDPGKGTGLGLAVSYDIIVRKHGGSLTVGDSSLGGALFRIELPVSPVIA